MKFERGRVAMLVRNTHENDSRVTREAAHLASLGYPVTVLAQQGHATAARETLHGYDVHRIPQTPLGQVGPLHRTLTQRTNTLRFARGVSHQLRKLRPRIIHCNDVDTLHLGAAHAKLLGARLVYDAHELWADVRPRPDSWRKRYNNARYQIVEGLCIQAADAVMTVCDAIADDMARRYRIKRPTVLRNVPEAFKKRTETDLKKHLNIAGEVLLHVGGVSPGRGIDVAIHALQRLPELHLVCLGDVSMGLQDKLAAHAQRADVAARVHFVPSVPMNEVISWTTSADYGLNGMEPSCRSQLFALPNKVFQYAHAGLPLVVTDLPEIARFVTTYRLGAVYAPGDPDDLVRAINMIREGTLPLANNEERQTALKEFTWEHESHVLSRVYEQLGVS